MMRALVRRGTAAGVAAAVLASLITVGLPTTAAADDVIIVRDGESIQEAIDAAEPGTTIQVRGDHVEQVWINKDGIDLVGKKATLSMPDEPDFEGPCGPTLICVISPSFTGEVFPPPPEDYLNKVRIKGFTLSNPIFDAIGVYFTNKVTVERNTIAGSGCSAIWMLLSSEFFIERNDVSGSVDCSTIDVAASTDGSISRNTATDGAFTGINVDDGSNVVIKRNTATGNCIGIVAGDSQGPLRSENIMITRNQANGNNTVCFPFGEGIPIGAAGILVGGPNDVTVSRNTASNNVTTLETVTPGGIVITDFPNPDGTSQETGEVVVKRNTAEGNMTAAGPLDLNINTFGGPVIVSKNRCGVGAPDPSWCTS